MQLADGKLFTLFSFDVGYEINLERLRLALHAGVRPGMRGSKKIAPAHLQYSSPPLVLPIGERQLVLIERPVVADVSLRIHEFGAITVVMSMPLTNVDFAMLPSFTASLTAGGTLENDARAVLREVFPQIASAISRPGFDGAGLVEDYYVLQVTRFAPPLDAATLLGAHRDLLARTLHCEPEHLSKSEIDDVLKTAVTYTPDDLVVTDWNVALVYDEDYEDPLNVLELLNVQLLELRFLDASLDRRIDTLYEHVAKRRWLFSFRREVLRLRALAELRLDTATIRERMTNALKLIGDLYLVKIYTRTAERLHLAAWQGSLDGKLDLIERISDVFTSRAATARAELLELAIVLLIVFEIALFFVR